MSTYNGAISSSAILPETDLSGNISAFGTPFAYTDLSYVAPSSFGGDVTGDGVVAPITATHDGVIASSARDYYYDRIWVIPQRTDFGNLTSEQVISIEVWNAYGVVKELDEITTEGQTDGTVLTGRASGDFAPFESVMYTLRVTTFGSPVFEGKYLWHFPGKDTPFTTLIGRRVIPFTFKHNWSSEVIERIGYLNRVLRGLSGKEQRFGLRRHPRRSFEYSHLVADGQRQRFENLLIGWHQRTFALPIWTDKQRLTAELAADSPSLLIDTRYRDFEVGGLIMFWKADNNYELVEIESMTSTEIIFKTSTIHTWAIGTAVIPVRLAELDVKAGWTKLTGGISTMRAVWQLQAGQPLTNRLGSDDFDTYKGVEVFTPRHNWAEAQAVDQSAGTTTVDFEFGVRLLLPQEIGPHSTGEITMLIEGRENIADFWAFLDRRSGSRIGAWFEQRSPDFTLVQDMESVGTTFSISNANYTNFAFQFEYRRDITIWVSRTEKYHRRITGASVDVDGTEIISIDSAIGVDLIAANKPVISYLHYIRLEADEIETAWITDDKLQVKVRLKELLTVPE